MNASSEYRPKPGKRWLLLLWFVLAVVLGLVAWFWKGDPEPFVVVDADEGFSLAALWRNTQAFFPWFVFAPVVVWVCTRFPFRLRSSLLVVPVLAATAALFMAGSSIFHRHLAKQGPAMMLTLGDPGGALEGAVLQSFRSAFENIPAEHSPGGLQQFEIEGFEDLEGFIGGLFAGTISEDGMVSSVTNIQIETSIIMPPQTEEVTISEPVERDGLDLELLAMHLAGFLLIAGLAHAAVYLRESQERRQRAELLSHQLTEARLTQLQSQMQPHFLFNALNGISSHIDDDPDQAVAMTSKLAELLRHSLQTSKTSGLIPLAKELEILELYLDLQAMRFADRLTITRDIHPDVLSAKVPPFLLQPLAENTIMHALEPHAGAVELRITAAPEGPDQVRLEVIDDGPGPRPDAPSQGTGTGLSNLQQRLTTLFGDEASLQMSARSAPDSGALITITVPRHATALPNPDRG